MSNEVYVEGPRCKVQTSACEMQDAAVDNSRSANRQIMPDVRIHDGCASVQSHPFPGGHELRSARGHEWETSHVACDPAISAEPCFSRLVLPPYLDNS